jgi:hypothetical protein
MDGREGLAALVARVSALERRVAQLEARGRQPDALADARLLGALAAVFGQAVFSVTDAQTAAMHDAVLAAAVDGLTSRRLGAWLRRLARTAAADGPYRLLRVGRDANGVLWAVYLTTDIHTVAGTKSRVETA